MLAALLTTLALAAPPIWVDTIPGAPDLRGKDTITVLVFGDSGKGATFKSVAEAAHRVCFEQRADRPCDLGVLLGDNVYEDGMTSPADAAWTAAFAAPLASFAARPDFRFWVTAGNHDWRPGVHHDRGLRKIQAAIDTTKPDGLWQFPALAYEVPALPTWLHLYSVDTTSIVREGPRIDAMFDDLRGRMGRYDPDQWHVVFGHHAPVSTGPHAILDTYENNRWSTALERLRGLGLDLVLAGHDHHQEHLVTGGIPVLLQGNSSKGRKVHDTAYLDCREWCHPGESKGKTHLGFLIVTFTRDRAVVDFFDERGDKRNPDTTLAPNPAGDGREMGRCAPVEAPPTCPVKQPPR